MKPHEKTLAAKPYVLTPSAGNHLKGIWRYTKKEWGSDQAFKYTNQIKQTLEELSLHPERGRPIDRIASGLRYRRSGRHYIFYFVTENQIQIVGILHEQMDHGRHLGSL